MIIAPNAPFHVIIAPNAPFHAVARANKWRAAPGDVVVFVDPALRSAGVALFGLDRVNGGDVASFHAATNVHNDGSASDMFDALAATLATWPLFTTRRSFCVVEKMQDYKGKAARAEGLDKVRAVTDLLREQGAADPWPPVTWKGQIPKPVHHARLASVLGRPVDRFGPDAWDAIGIGLYAFGATRRGGAT